MKTGDYVRTKEGFIARVIEIYEGNIECDAPIKTLYEEKYNCLWDEEKENIIKSSPNIIDLIEIGDYVNGLLIVEYNEENKCFICECCGMECGENWIYRNNEIKSILTKEQFEAIKYEIK